MKKSIITLTVVLYSILTSNAQELNERFAELLDEIVTERVEVMELDKKQAKTLKESQKERLLLIQDLREVHKPGTDEFKAKVKELNKKYNKALIDLITPEQRKKWAAHMKAKRENKNK